MGNWKSLDVMNNLGQSLGNLAGSITGYDRRKRRNDLADEALNFKVGTQGEQFNREGRKLNLDFSRLDHDVNSQAQDYEVAKAGLADRPVQRQHEIKSREMEGLKGIMPALPYLLGGGDPGVVGQGMEMERSRRGSIAGTTAGAAAGASDAVSKRKAREEALGRFMADPANKDIPRDQIGARFRQTEMEGMRHSKPSNIVSPELYRQRKTEDADLQLYNAIIKKAGDVSDIQTDFPEDYARVMAKFGGGRGPGKPTNAPAPTPSPLVAAPADDVKARALSIAQQLGFSANDNDWTDEEVEAIRAELNK